MMEFLIVYLIFGLIVFLFYLGYYNKDFIGQGWGRVLRYFAGITLFWLPLFIISLGISVRKLEETDMEHKKEFAAEKERLNKKGINTY